MNVRVFTLEELRALLAANGDTFDDEEQIDASDRAIYVRADGKTWRLIVRTNTDGEDEVAQSIRYDQAAEKKDWERFSYSWSAVEVKQVQVLVRRYVVVEET